MSDRPLSSVRTLPRGFTLLELLIVVFILVILISILLPTITLVRSHGERTRCATNLRSIGQSAMLYAAEQRGWILRDGSTNYTKEKNVEARRPFIYMVDPQLQNVPAVERMKLAAAMKVLQCPAYPYPNAPTPSTYVVNAFVITKASPFGGLEIAGPTRLSAVRRPSAIAFVFDAACPLWSWEGDADFTPEHYEQWDGVLSAWHRKDLGRGNAYIHGRIAAFRHQNLINVLYFDGSVKSVERASLTSADLDDGITQRVYRQLIPAGAFGDYD